ncbi:MAG: pyruvate formate-lyase [Ruminococcaceae bacterium]|nr:pyruvate formate-lyase [Oscillospiraceae bacterium]
MTKNVELLLRQLKDKSYRSLRTMEKEEPILYPVDYFGFHIGTNERLPSGGSGNLTPAYDRVIRMGFDGLRQELQRAIACTESYEEKAYGRKLMETLDHGVAVCDAYRERVRTNSRLYEALGRVPRKGATSFYEACLTIIICIYLLRTSRGTHLGLGRFDQYMYPYYLADKARGVTEEELFETLEAFFISLNFDSDLYTGVQQGDNGQSMVLGGFDMDGNSVYNELSDLCMDASLELNLIDPKINLRVGKKTPIEMYVKATYLTKKGLGFPQYCNDDVVVPGLIKLGYDPEDAQNYVVAACWEYIIPGRGADVVNRGPMNFPLVINRVIKEKLNSCSNFEELMTWVEQGIKQECDRIIESYRDRKRMDIPLLSALMDGCTKRLRPMREGGVKYINFGCHGTGIANATDALAAVKLCVFDQKRICPQQLLEALEADFEGFQEIRNLLRSCPKMGNNDPMADEIACRIMDCFSKNMNNRPNGQYGHWRAGTGSAMEYLWSAAKCGATADGRKAGTPYSSSFSPSMDVKPTGLLSVIQSFTKYDMTEIINGGPLTLEIHDSVLRNDIGVEKTAMLVKLFIDRGGHQLQLNSINRERLIDAQENPEKYPNLIVRVWGWSGYFNELDKAYQDHIINRLAYQE